MNEYHISSFIVRCHKQHLIRNVEQINQLEGAEVHEVESTGKLIVTVEGSSHRFISNITETIRDMPEVLDVAAVYHEYTSDTQI
ncbi:chaperone NapD [Paraglaciecola aquimarina]|uniref:Chaperone NapD n=1 Tax=Paraglaciecola algarum TaxID=3050085 RepID=A0ABS9D4Y1_9ALTE|nr:chaperone NapD [Paraglaciecola sp. G1-23]MCF2947986.1 chaperone NapD [Paraglaciecola sp. G1-23]